MLQPVSIGNTKYLKMAGSFDEIGTFKNGVEHLILKNVII
jgi:hypothetical protein